MVNNHNFIFGNALAGAVGGLLGRTHLPLQPTPHHQQLFEAILGQPHIRRDLRPVMSPIEKLEHDLQRSSYERWCEISDGSTWQEFCRGIHVMSDGDGRGWTVIDA